MTSEKVSRFWSKHYLMIIDHKVGYFARNDDPEIFWNEQTGNKPEIAVNLVADT